MRDQRMPAKKKKAVKKAPTKKSPKKKNIFQSRADRIDKMSGF